MNHHVASDAWLAPFISDPVLLICHVQWLWRAPGKHYSTSPVPMNECSLSLRGRLSIPIERWRCQQSISSIVTDWSDTMQCSWFCPHIEYLETWVLSGDKWAILGSGKAQVQRPVRDQCVIERMHFVIILSLSVIFKLQQSLWFETQCDSYKGLLNTPFVHICIGKSREEGEREQYLLLEVCISGHWRK